MIAKYPFSSIMIFYVDCDIRIMSIINLYQIFFFVFDCLFVFVFSLFVYFSNRKYIVCTYLPSLKRDISFCFFMII